MPYTLEITVSPLRLRRRLRLARGSLAVAAAILAVSAAVAVHHAEPAAAHDGMGDHGAAAMVMCLGVLVLGAVTLAARPRLGRLLAQPPRAGDVTLPAGPPRDVAFPRARAGPPLFVRLQVFRR